MNSISPDERINFPREYEGWDIDCSEPVEFAGSLPDEYDPFQ